MTNYFRNKFYKCKYCLLIVFQLILPFFHFRIKERISLKGQSKEHLKFLLSLAYHKFLWIKDLLKFNRPNQFFEKFLLIRVYLTYQDDEVKLKYNKPS